MIQSKAFWQISCAVICMMAIPGPVNANKIRAKTNTPVADTLSVGGVEAVPVEVAAPHALDNAADTRLKIEDSSRPVSSTVVNPTLYSSATSISESVQLTDSNKVIIGVDTSSTIKPAIKTGASLQSIEELRAQAKQLRKDAEELTDLADKLADEGDNVDDKADELSDHADDLEDNLQDTAENIASSIERAIISGDTTLHADSLMRHGSVAVSQRRELIAKIKAESQKLIAKSREIAVKVKQMETEADKRFHLAGELEARAEALDPRSLWERYPIQAILDANISSVPPFEDNNRHILLNSGTGFAITLSRHHAAGIKEIGFAGLMIDGDMRYLVSAAPFWEGSIFLARAIQVGVDVGLCGQYRFDPDRENILAIAPFVGLFNQFWISRHFSLGPVVRLNYAAYNDFSIWSNRAGMLPQGALWSDAGISLIAHF